ncbi:MAG: RluA family pseudouridine synthase, partial [Lachnospiraceae bacterium]|nr:RluA family pseudouridine synthase [Lachnospiraceae bacterium]
MERIITYHIDETFQNQTILQFLKKKRYTDKAIIALKKTPEGILLNDVWAYVNQKISSGDILTIKLSETESSEKIVPEKLDIDIVYEDEDILVVNKPWNMPVHPSQNHYTGTLANGIAYYFVSQDKPFIFRCVNRLDRDTTGLTILCKHQLASGILSNMVSERLIKRTYLAICTDDGSLPENGTITAPIARKEGSTIERTVDYEKGEAATTHFKRLLHLPDKQISLIQLRLETGRTHQIRVH